MAASIHGAHRPACGCALHCRLASALRDTAIAGMHAPRRIVRVEARSDWCLRSCEHSDCQAKELPAARRRSQESTARAPDRSAMHACLAADRRAQRGDRRLRHQKGSLCGWKTFSIANQFSRKTLKIEKREMQIVSMNVQRASR